MPVILARFSTTSSFGIASSNVIAPFRVSSAIIPTKSGTIPPTPAAPARVPRKDYSELNQLSELVFTVRTEENSILFLEDFQGQILIQTAYKAVGIAEIIIPILGYNLLKAGIGKGA